MIRLKHVKYSEFEGELQEWRLDGLSLDQANLIVGKNASGKTRTLNVIRGLARQLAGVNTPYISGHYNFEFIHDNKKLHYVLKYQEKEVVEERFSIDDEILLERGVGGEGMILAEEIGNRIRFQTPPSELAAVARQDAIQHKFLRPLNAWGTSLRHYGFGTALGKDRLTILAEKNIEDIDEWDPHVTVDLYKKAAKEFSNSFASKLIDDMQKLDYDIEEIGIRPLLSIQVKSNYPGEVGGLFVKEKSLPGITDHNSMSSGMFRALALLIHVNYSIMANKSTCILVDDIGEGLDFDRSCRLIDLLREKTKASNIQLILSTNDRFVMNRVPLEEWSVLQRHGNHVQVLNYENSRELFEEFKFTGLSNFSFLEMDFANSSLA